jgi:hypothetical protein
MVCFQCFSDEPMLQAALLAHVGIETYSSFVRTKAYYSEPSPLRWTESAALEAHKPKTNSAEPLNLGKSPNRDATGAANPQSASLSSSVVAGVVGKTKQFMSMLGTAMIMIPFTHSLGAALVVISVPFAVASVAQKSKKVRVYAEVQQGPITAKTMEFIEQSKALGSSLVVGVRPAPPGVTSIPIADLEQIIRLHPSVDFLLASDSLPAPGGIADKGFLAKYSIDIVSVQSSLTFETVETSPEDWRSGKIVPVRVDV